MPGLCVNGPRPHAQFQAVSENRTKIGKRDISVSNRETMPMREALTGVETEIPRVRKVERSALGARASKLP